jgi:hypothetical protein
VHEYAGRLETAIPARCDGQPAVIVGGADGFVTAYALADGRWLRSHLAHGPVVSVTPSAAGGLIVATHTGLEVLDSGWQPRAALARPLRRALPLGDCRLLLTREDHTLELIELPS